MIFSTLSQVRDLSWAWLMSYNKSRKLPVNVTDLK